MLDTALLATVAAVVREGSFERAASTLHITPSAVSQRIRLAEERVGAVLVVRGLPCTPTEAGARLCRHADTVALLESDLQRDMPLLRSDALQPHPTMRIAINADSLATWFVAAMQAFCKTNAPLLDIVVDDQDKTSEWLRRGQVLAAVTSLAKPVQGCRSRKLGALRYYATASPDFVQHWFSRGVTAEQLARAPSLVFDRNDRLQDQWVRRLTRKTLPMPAHRLPSSQAFVDATLAGLGWGMNPIHLVREHLQTGRLVELLPQRPLDIALYWQAAKLPLQALSQLSNCVMEAAGRALET